VRRLMNLFCLSLCLGMGGNVPGALAQSEESDRVEEMADERELETDRDAFTPSTSTAGERLTIFESSYSFIDNRSVAETHSLPELLVRHGLTEQIEVRVGWNYEVGGSGDIVSGNEGAEGFQGGKIERDSNLLYGFKAALTQQDGWLPRSAVILQGFTPTSGESPQTDFVAAYALGWEFANHWRLDSSMRYGTEHSPNDAFNQWDPSVVLRVPITERWNVHGEYFGIYSQGAEREFSRAFFSPGTHYLLTPNLELGVRLGWGLTEDAPRFFSNVGVGWRF
jgi:Putative MetA-pathway of phenol degradation